MLVRQGLSLHRQQDYISRLSFLLACKIGAFRGRRLRFMSVMGPLNPFAQRLWKIIVWQQSGIMFRKKLQKPSTVRSTKDEELLQLVRRLHALSKQLRG
jgi:hypothetical protein